MPQERGGLLESRIVNRPLLVLTDPDAAPARHGRPAIHSRGRHCREEIMLEIRRLGPKIGVEIRGIDVKTMDDDTFAKIYQAWLDCNVMCVRGQELTIPDFIRYSERFGPVTPHPSKSTRHPEYPKITLLG